MKKTVIAIVIVLAAVSAIAYFVLRRGTENVLQKKNVRIAIIGNTFAERMQHYNYFETLLYKNYPSHSIVVRNFGWSGDEVAIQLRPLRFPDTEEWLADFQPDVILACFGMNESFGGLDSLDSFERHLSALVNRLKRRLRGDSTRIILVSPIAHEALGGDFPDPSEHNNNLREYSARMRQISNKHDWRYLDLFEPTFQAMRDTNSSLTLNGIHLHDAGYQFVAEQMVSQLQLPLTSWQPGYNTLKELIDLKNKQFFYLYRAVNSEYIYGRRKEPWVQPPGGPISYPKELSTLDQQVRLLDSLLRHIDEERINNTLAEGRSLVSTCPLKDTFVKMKADPQSFKLRKGFAANLFASEAQFPIEKPVKITFDPQGRMWVATMSSYPQYHPGCPPNDKIVILEDTDKDGVADRHTVFADSLYMPLSFEIGYGGVFVSQPPNLVFLKDTNGDDKADVKNILLHGFGTEDVHHSISAFTWGPDGALYMHSGTFLHTQVETPYGPVRNAYGETYRYEPRTMKLDTYISYPYANPWGNVFMRDGTHLIGDVSTGMNYFAAPLTTATTYPFKHTLMRDFLTDQQRPKTCGMEIVSSRHFPEDMQGSVLFNTFIGFQGITNHQIVEKESGVEGIKRAPLLQSSDPNFRPVDLQFGPDGALYVADWYNPIINHGERALRDPMRDKVHGRIWRVSHQQRKLLPTTDLDSLPAVALLDQLKSYEDRTRYRARVQLSHLPRGEVIAALDKWINLPDSSVSRNDSDLLEALWIYQQCNQPTEHVLRRLLDSKQPNTRAAAVNVLFHWRHHFSWSLDSLVSYAKDQSPRVRLYSIVALSHYRDIKAVQAILDASQLPMDDYIRYAVTQTLRELSGIWKKQLRDDAGYLRDEPAKVQLLIASLLDRESLKMPSFLEPDPKKPMYERAALTHQEINSWQGIRMPDQLVTTRYDKDRLRQDSSRTGKVLNISTVPGKMAFDKTLIDVKAGERINIVFNNPDDMAHNLVITKPESATIVGEAADRMAQLPNGYEKNFVPSLPDVLHFTPLVASGETFELTITAPMHTGDYPFLCTFPGHWRMMRGILRVSKQ